MINETDLEAWEYYNSKTLNDYQAEAMKTKAYPDDKRIIYPVGLLTEEAGEVAGKLNKYHRDGTWDRDAIIKEMGDVMWALAALASDLNVSLEEVADRNIKKLRDRKKRGVIQGSGDKR
jgi:NTP pyrophosphatase (non-canonical NTP hydrolase)